MWITSLLMCGMFCYFAGESAKEGSPAFAVVYAAGAAVFGFCVGADFGRWVWEEKK
jgi:hypothetical protein